jgi:predicted DNA-binding protein
MHRRDKKRGPYIRPETYNRVKELSENKDVPIGNVIDEIVLTAINEDGIITANQLKTKTEWDYEK